jgi:DivIVA domain-containing protein
MVEDRRLTITSTARLHPEEVARRTFTTSRRGFDTSEVRAYLEQVGREMAAAQDREKELRELLADAERRAANPVLDEATLTAALGQETARVLRTAHDAASELVSRAESDANRIITEAEEEAGKLQARAEQNAVDRSAQSEALAAETRRRAQEEATVRLDAAHSEADGLVEQARVECRAMLLEAQELRSRVLGDLTRRRRILHSQIEQLRAGRERLAETISGVSDSVDRITDDLFRAEDEARMAAEAAGRQLAAQEEMGALAAATSGSVEVRSAPEEIGVPSSDPGGDESARQEPPTVVVAPEEIGVIDVEANGPSKEQTVEELFARLRAERGTEDDSELGSEEDTDEVPVVAAVEAPEVAEAHEGPEADEASEADEGQEAAGGGAGEKVVSARKAAGPARSESGKAPDDTQASGGSRAKTTSKASVDRKASAGEAEVVTKASVGSQSAAGAEDREASEATAPDGEAHEPEEPEGDPVLARRNEVLQPIAATLARRLKRALTDDQNDILDRLRGAKGWSPDVLPPQDEHIERYLGAGQEPLAEAAGAGATFVGGKPDDAPDVGEFVSDLATAIVVPLRRRLDGDDDELDASDEAFMVEHVGAAFRDWKGARIERLATDEAVAAFSRAVLAASDSGTRLVWVVDDDGIECPDCDDNALAGPTPRGEAFPTGHPHPPAHAGCRCLLSPFDA